MAPTPCVAAHVRMAARCACEAPQSKKLTQRRWACFQPRTFTLCFQPGSACWKRAQAFLIVCCDVCSVLLSVYTLSTPLRAARHVLLWFGAQTWGHVVVLAAVAWLRMQDTPSVKMTYTATVTVAEPLRALMSAETVEEPEPAPSRFSAKLSGPLATYAFRQRQPMPAYLLALAVGEVESRRVGPRSRVWAEPSVVEKAAWEFAETEAFLAAGARACIRARYATDR